MVKFGSLCVVVFLVVGVVDCNSSVPRLPVDQLKISLFDALSYDDQITLEDALKQTYETLYNGVLQVFVEMQADNVALEAIEILPILSKALNLETDPSDNLIQTLKSHGGFDNVEAVFKNIYDNYYNVFSIQLKDGYSMYDSNKAEFLQNMEIYILEMLGIFSKSFLLSLPELAAPVLIALSPIIVSYMLFLKMKAPERIAETYIPCLLKDLIEDYYNLTLWSRLNKIEVHSLFDDFAQQNTYDLTNNHIKLVDTFGVPSSGYIRCEARKDGDKGSESYDKLKIMTIERMLEYKDGEIFERHQDEIDRIGKFTVIKDNLGQKDEYFFDQYWKCAADYFEVVQNKTAVFFFKAFAASQLQCEQYPKVFKRNTTGDFWLHMHLGALHLIKAVKPAEEGNEPESIDIGGGWDPYVLVFIDGRQVHRSATKRDEKLGWTYLNERLMEDVRNTSYIRFELWDDDTGYLLKDDNDLLFNVTYPINELPSRIPYLPNQNYYLYLDFILLDIYETINNSK